MNKFYTIVILGLILVLLLREGCNCARIKKLEKNCSQTITKIDTAWIRDTTTVAVYVPKPGAVVYRDIPKYITKVINGETRYIPVDTSEILKDYFASVPYLDSVAVKYGKVYINDTVSQNRITARSIRTDFSFPVVTVTNTVTERKAYLSAGVNVLGTQKDGVNMAGVSLMYTSGRRLSIEISGMYGTRGIAYGLGVKFPLSLK